MLDDVEALLDWAFCVGIGDDNVRAAARRLSHTLEILGHEREAAAGYTHEFDHVSDPPDAYLSTKIQCIKKARALWGISHKEAKHWVEKVKPFDETRGWMLTASEAEAFLEAGAVLRELGPQVVPR